MDNEVLEVLLEYSEIEKRVYLRAVWPKGQGKVVPKIHPDNTQNLSQIFQKIATRIPVFGCLVPEEN
jgi:hypothetical protein